jgi:hypothetical protein
MKSAILSNQRLINEINSIKDDFIQSRPHMQMSVFKATRRGDGRSNKYDNAEQPKFLRGGGSPAFQKHPLGYQPPNGSTATVDPLFSGVVDRPVPRGGAMLRRALPLTGEDSESDDEGASVLNGYSSSDDDSFHRGRGLKGAEPLDYDDGAGLADTAKRAYSAMSKKSQDAIVKLAPYAKEISKKLTSPMALKIGTSGLSILFLAIASGYVGPLVSKAILPVITAKIFQIAGDVSEGVMSLATAKKEVKKAADEAKEKMVESPSGERTEVTYGTTDEPEGMGLKRFGKGKAASKATQKGGKINKIVGTKRGESVRGAIVAELMKKHGMKLGEASKYAKVHGLY